MASETKISWRDCGPSPFGDTRSVLDMGDFYVSYNPRPSPMVPMFGSDDGGPETALVKDGEYFILNGDFRDAYEQLVPLGFEACKQFYDQQAPHARSSWSDGKAA